MQGYVATAGTTLTLIAGALVSGGPVSAAPSTAPAPTSSLQVAAVQYSAASRSATMSLRLRAAVKRLKVAREKPRGYDRDKFGDWVDADHDCRDTRDEVLRAESLRRVKGRCDVRRGRWHSYYDDRYWRRSSDVDIDHVVPLAEAWRSGARRWTKATRVAYANDLRDGRTLVAVTDNVNQSKGDRDPSDWMPQYRRCLYVKQYTAVKLRWGLKVNRPEKRVLRRVASHCPNSVVKVRRAHVGLRSGGGGGGGGGLDPQFDTCTEAKAAGYGPYYKGKDEEYWWYTDADSDGIVCE